MSIQLPPDRPITSRRHIAGRRYKRGAQHASDHAVLVVQRKYGVSGQIVPKELFRLVQDKDPARSKRVMKAMLQMVKLDVARLQQAANES